MNNKVLMSFDPINKYILKINVLTNSLIVYLNTDYECNTPCKRFQIISNESSHVQFYF